MNASLSESSVRNGSGESATQRDQLIRSISTLITDLNTDVLLYNGPISDRGTILLHDAIDDALVESDSVFFILVTDGGDGNAAYMIAKYLQQRYARVVGAVPGPCWSAGTLAMLGANELVMGEWGTMGPLDVQLLKPDEIWERRSGLTRAVALDALRREAYQAFEEVFLALKARSGGAVRLRTAMEIAINFVSPLYAPVFGQIDPMKLGEDEREMRIAEHYGKRLEIRAKNLKPGGLDQLLRGYPSHDAIIDLQEGEELFNHIREASVVEAELFSALGLLAMQPLNEPDMIVSLLSAVFGDNASRSDENEEPEPGACEGDCAANGEPAGEEDPANAGCAGVD